MFGLTRWNSFDDVFNFQREVDRLFNQFWSDLPTRTPAGSSPSFQVPATDDGWRIDVPMPGIDPKDVSLEAAGSDPHHSGRDSGRRQGPATARATNRRLPSRSSSTSTNLLRPTGTGCCG